jgi:3-methyladenine DNA glycosylase AlkD
VAAISSAIAARADPSYEWGMRRTVPSSLPAHATRVSDVRRVASRWLRANRKAKTQDVLAVAEALWSSTWREERIAASMLIGRRRDVLASIDWSLVERWTREVDNWEHIDNLAGAVTSPLLLQHPELLENVRSMSHSDHPWQRRCAVVTLLGAARHDAHLIPDLERMAEHLKTDPHPLVRKAVVWARSVLAKHSQREPAEEGQAER